MKTTQPLWGRPQYDSAYLEGRGHRGLSFMDEPGPEIRVYELVFPATFKQNVNVDHSRNCSANGRRIVKSG